MTIRMPAADLTWPARPKLVDGDDRRADRDGLKRREQLLSICLEQFRRLPHFKHLNLIVAISSMEQAPFGLTQA